MPSFALIIYSFLATSAHYFR